MEAVATRQLRSAPFIMAGGAFVALMLAFGAQLADELIPMLIGLVALDALVVGAVSGAVVRGFSRARVALWGALAGAACTVVGCGVTAFARGNGSILVMLACAGGGAALAALAAVLGSVWAERR